MTKRSRASEALAAAARRRMPLSGSEETFTDVVYGSRPGKDNNNCYAWAFGRYANRGGVKLQPGNLAGDRAELNLAGCADMRRRVLEDWPRRDVYPADADAPCRAGYYKVMGFVHRGTDFHWYKQHRDVLVSARAGNTPAKLAREFGVAPDSVESPSPTAAEGDKVLVRGAGTWSHKRGFATGPLLRDSCGKVIRDPRAACRDYGEYNYRDFCGAYCVRSRRGD